MSRFSTHAAWIIALLLAASVHAQTLTYSVLLSGPNESPPNASPGTGIGQVDVNSTLHTMRVQVSFSGLTGTTTASHIHSATVTPFAGTAIVATTTPSFVGFPLGVTSGSYDSGLLDMTLTSSYNAAYITAHGGTTAQAEADLFASFVTGQAYLNIHTSTFGGGEIRGFLVAVPEPTTVALVGAIGVGLVVVEVKRRMKRRTRFAKQ